MVSVHVFHVDFTVTNLGPLLHRQQISQILDLNGWRFWLLMTFCWR